MSNLQADTLLSDLMNLSPAISDYVTGLQNGNDPDSLTIKDLINGCFEILIGLLTDQGILFYNEGGIAELLEDHYSASNIITLYKTVMPENLIVELSNDKTLLKIIENVMMDVKDDSEMLVHLLQVYLDHNPSDVNASMYNYLWDKVCSNTDFAKTLKIVLSKATDYNPPDESVDTFSLLSAIAKERKWFSNVVDTFLTGSFKDELDAELCYRVVDRFRSDLTGTEYLSTLSATQELEPSYIQDILTKLYMTNPYYIEYHIARDMTKQLTLLNIIVMICSSISNARLFGVKENHDILSNYREDTHDLITIINNIT